MDTASQVKIISNYPGIIPDLWNLNSPAQFWQNKIEIDNNVWNEAINKSLLVNQFTFDSEDINHFLYNTLGEGRFGDKHWNLSLINRLYWTIKPKMPYFMIRKVRGLVNKAKVELSKNDWPIENRYTQFQMETMRQILLISGLLSIPYKRFWPSPYQYALVLTHDVETVEGQSKIPLIADLDESKGFRSSFNIVGDQIPEDLSMLLEIKKRGFEIGVHGWHHDETAFLSRKNFLNSAKLINESLVKLDAIGYRSPLNLRQPEWMQSLNIEYDLSFFDTDPFEPISGGAMSIWPFKIGRFMELPATLVQDNTLINLLGEKTPQIWVEKVNYLRKYHGLALLNSHPDYLIHKKVWDVYKQFLDLMQQDDASWKVLPRDAARWWRGRSEKIVYEKGCLDSDFAEASLSKDNILILG